jgi:uncharacterized protein YlaI
MGHCGFISHNAVNKRHREKHKRLGLCPKCSNKVDGNFIYCLKHRKMNRHYLSKFREKLKNDM